MRWLLQRGFSLLFVITITFVSLRMMPGNAIESQMIQSGAAESTIQTRLEALGLDKPVADQYFAYLRGFIHGDWGVSLYSGQAVTEVIAINFYATLSIVIPALLLSIIWGISLGVIVSLRASGFLTLILRVLIALSIGMPIYWSATLFILLFSLMLNWLPSSGEGTLAHLMLPIAVLVLHTGGAIARVTQTYVNETKNADFVRMAHAKGLSQQRVITRYILRVGLIPIISVIALQAGYLISGTVITETVFVRPGLGRLLIDATLRRDYPIVQGVVLLSAIVYILLNALADVLMPLVDPRVRYPV